MNFILQNVVSTTQIDVVNGENAAWGCNVQVGDIVDIYEPANDTYCGRATVTAISPAPNGSGSRLTFDTPLSGMTAGMQVADLMLGAPGSTMNNCVIKGTQRFKGAITISNTRFETFFTWIWTEGNFEGPIPQNIKFVNCEFVDSTVSIAAFDAHRTGDPMMNNISTANNPLLPNIATVMKDQVTFTGCSFTDSPVSTAPAGLTYIVN